jgi:hypothetical protein
VAVPGAVQPPTAPTPSWPQVRYLGSEYGGYTWYESINTSFNSTPGSSVRSPQSRIRLPPAISSPAASTLNQSVLDTPPTLLSIPRELRNQIYEEVTTDIELSDNSRVDADGNFETGLENPEIIFYGAPCTNLLLVSRQVHDEYLDAIRPRAALHIVYLDTLENQALEVKSSVPTSATSHIRICFVWAWDKEDGWFEEWLQRHPPRPLVAHMFMGVPPSKHKSLFP